jgi:hypothetical protein
MLHPVNLFYSDLSVTKWVRFLVVEYIYSSRFKSPTQYRYKHSRLIVLLVIGDMSIHSGEM